GRFRFHVHATDWHGHDVDFTTPLIFMLGGQSQARMKELWPDRIQRYDQVLSTPASDVSIGLQGQRFTYADPQPGSDTTTLTTDTLVFSAEPAATPPRFLPPLRQANVHLTPLEQLLGTKAATTIVLYDPYVKGGYGAGGVFAQFKDPVAAKFSAVKGGGIATPNMTLGGLSRISGPVAGDLATV